MIALHMGGIPELAMALGPVLLIAVFIKIARTAESQPDDDADDWSDWDDLASEEVAERSTSSSDASSAAVGRRP